MDCHFIGTMDPYFFLFQFALEQTRPTNAIGNFWPTNGTESFVRFRSLLPFLYYLRFMVENWNIFRYFVVSFLIIVLKMIIWPVFFQSYFQSQYYSVSITITTTPTTTTTTSTTLFFIRIKCKYELHQSYS